MGVGYLSLFCLLWDFFLLGCLVQPRYEDFCLILLYHVSSCLVAISWRPALFWRGRGMKKRDGRELGGVEGGKTVVKMYCMRK